jgi:hypothetical protein
MVQILLFEMTDLSMVFPPSPNKIYCSNLPSQAIANAIDGIKLYLINQQMKGRNVIGCCGASSG